MDIQLDNETKAQLSALAELHNMSTADLVAKWVRRESVKAENKKRLNDMKENGGIPHDDMMEWLDNFAAGKAV